MRSLLLAGCACLAWMTEAAGAMPVQLVIATVNNGQMIQLQEFGAEFERAHPDIRLRWVTLDEQALRRYVGTDLATRGGQFDVVTIGLYEAALWPRRGWLTPIRPGPDYAVGDLLPNIRAGLSHRGELYALPFYGESSMLMYRKDLMRKAGLSMPDAPTWRDIAGFAARLDDPARGVHGICLRGKPGWGINMTLVTTMVNAFGGQWFDMAWRPRLDSAAWREAVGLYVSLLRNYGPPDAAAKGYNENLKLFQEGKCALWVDATVAGGFVANPALSKSAAEVGFAPAPVARTAKGSSWLWSWAFAIPATTRGAHADAARRFVLWATSRDYVALVGARKGWDMVPAGTRTSTYGDLRYRRAAPWGKHEIAAIANADPDDATLPDSPYTGVQFAAIPAFRAIGDEVGELVAQALAGHLSVAEALARAQRSARRQLVIDNQTR